MVGMTIKGVFIHPSRWPSLIFKKIIDERRARTGESKSKIFKELSEKYSPTGCDASFFHQIYGGSRNIKEEVIRKIAEILKIDEEVFYKMPPEIGEEGLDRLWERFYKKQKTPQGSVLEEILDFMDEIESGEQPVEALEAWLMPLRVFRKMKKGAKTE